jgi:hypothetical protein
MERCRITPAQVFVELHTPGEGPQGPEAPHHAVVFKLMPDRVHLVRAGFLVEPLDVVRRWPRLMLVAVHDGRDESYIGATRLSVIVIIVVSHGRGL